MATKRSSETVSATPVPARRKTTTARSRKKLPVAQPETAVETSTESAPEAVAVMVAVTYEPTYHEVAALAYSYWEARGYQEGAAEEDWLRAEQELRARTASVATA